MSSQSLSKLRVALPLWQRQIPKYPLYVEGNPQLRVFLPLFWMKLIRNNREKGADRVTFEVHPQMTNIDIKNYLEKIYGVKVLSVTSQLRKGAWMKAFGPEVWRHPNFRVAHVHLEEEFKFPEIFKDRVTEESKAVKDFAKLDEQFKAEQRKQFDRTDVPSWFR